MHISLSSLNFMSSSEEAPFFACLVSLPFPSLYFPSHSISFPFKNYLYVSHFSLLSLSLSFSPLGKKPLLLPGATKLSPAFLSFPFPPLFPFIPPSTCRKEEEEEPSEELVEEKKEWSFASLSASFLFCTQKMTSTNSKLAPSALREETSAIGRRAKHSDRSHAVF